MLKIKVVKSTYKIEMEEHAEYAEKGKDIVCAAASILLYTLADTIDRSEKMLWNKPRIRIDEQKVKAFVQCVPKPEYEGNIALIYQTVLNGLQLLAAEYPENVSMKIV